MCVRSCVRVCVCAGGGESVMGALWLMIWESSKGLSREGWLQQKMALELMTSGSLWGLHHGSGRLGDSSHYMT